MGCHRGYLGLRDCTFLESPHPEPEAYSWAVECLPELEGLIERCCLVPFRKCLMKLKVKTSPAQTGVLTFHQRYCYSLSSWGIFWLPTPASPASISTGRARQTRWRTAKMSTRPPTSAACSRRPVYRERCHLLDWCRTTPWTACKINHQIKIMDKRLFLSVHSSTLQTHIWTRRPWMYQGHYFYTAYANGMYLALLQTDFVSCALFCHIQACTTSFALF